MLGVCGCLDMYLLMQHIAGKLYKVRMTSRSYTLGNQLLTRRELLVLGPSVPNFDMYLYNQ